MAEARTVVQMKRAYDAPQPADGTRVLIDRLWPRGLTKDAARIDLWLKDVAPSKELRIWYGHDPARFDEFRHRYQRELAVEPGRSALAQLRSLSTRGTVTLIFAAKDAEHSDAAVLRDMLNSAR